MQKLKDLIPEKYTPMKEFPDVIDAHLVKRGADRHAKYEWVTVTSQKWNAKKAADFQTKNGKKPAGYDFFDFKSVKKGKNWINTWKSMASAN